MDGIKCNNCSNLDPSVQLSADGMTANGNSFMCLVPTQKMVQCCDSVTKYAHLKCLITFCCEVGVIVWCHLLCEGWLLWIVTSLGVVSFYVTASRCSD